MKDHPAVVAALVAAGLIAARLLAIARFDVNTAAVILQVSGTGTALAGTTLTLLPFAVVGGAIYLSLAVFIDASLLRSQAPGEWLLSLAIAAAVCLVAFALLIPTLILVLGMMALRRRLVRSGRTISIVGALKSSRLLRVEATILVGVAAMAPLVLQRPWLPLQQLSLADDTVVVGYVLGEAQGQTVVMNDTDRTISFVDPDEIESRQVCAGGARPAGALSGVPTVQLSESALGLLLWGDDTPTYPACRD